VWLTAREVAEQVRVGLKVVYRAAKSGRLRHVLIDGTGNYRFKQEWVNAWMEAECRGGRR